PGNEAPCISYVADLLGEAGIPVQVLARDPARPNLVARLAGGGAAPPLLLQGHGGGGATPPPGCGHAPLCGGLGGGDVWGRGALDMKGGVAMMLAAVLRAKAEDAALPGDVVLALVADEEAAGEYGAKFLVEQHADLFAGVRYALGEFGGFTLWLAGRPFY